MRTAIVVGARSAPYKNYPCQPYPPTPIAPKKTIKTESAPTNDCHLEQAVEQAEGSTKIAPDQISHSLRINKLKTMLASSRSPIAGQLDNLPHSDPDKVVKHATSSVHGTLTFLQTRKPYMPKAEDAHHAPQSRP